jgi:hypothetical protein
MLLFVCVVIFSSPTLENKGVVIHLILKDSLNGIRKIDWRFMLEALIVLTTKLGRNFKIQ